MDVPVTSGTAGQPAPSSQPTEQRQGLRLRRSQLDSGGTLTTEHDASETQALLTCRCCGALRPPCIELADGYRVGSHHQSDSVCAQCHAFCSSLIARVLEPQSAPPERQLDSFRGYITLRDHTCVCLREKAAGLPRPRRGCFRGCREQSSRHDSLQRA